MLFKTCAVLFVLSCYMEPNQAWIKTSANDFIDDVLKSSFQYESSESHLDPLALPDFKSDFQDYVTLIGKVKGHVDYMNGKLEGLSMAKRNTECKGPFMGFNYAVMNCSVSFDDLRISYDGKLKYGKLPSASISAVAKMNKTVLYIDVVSYPQSLVPIMRSFRFLEIGAVQTKFTGLGSALNKYLKVLDIKFKEQAWNVFFNAIGQEFQFAFSRAVSRVPLAWF